MNHFYVGQDIQCIDDKYKHVSNDQIIREGVVYRIRWLGMYHNYVDGDFLWVKLEGIDRGVDPTYGYDDPPFAARRFRPLVQDPLAVFRNIAADPDGYMPIAPEEPKCPVRVKEDEEA